MRKPFRPVLRGLAAHAGARNVVQPPRTHPRGGCTQQPQVANCLIMCRPTSIEAAEHWMAANKVCAPPQRPTGDTGECGGKWKSMERGMPRATEEQERGQREAAHYR
jgi:hypothetical protein